MGCSSLDDSFITKFNVCTRPKIRGRQREYKGILESQPYQIFIKTLYNSLYTEMGIIC